MPQPKRVALPTVFIAAFALAVAIPARPAPVLAASGPDIAHFSLANGLEVVVIPDHRTPVVTHMVWYRVGGADETAGKSGLAHFLEHLMFKGTSKHPVGEFSQTVLRVGGNENASTSVDYTNYYQRVPKELRTITGRNEYKIRVWSRITG